MEYAWYRDLLLVWLGIWYSQASETTCPSCVDQRNDPVALLRCVFRSVIPGISFDAMQNPAECGLYCVLLAETFEVVSGQQLRQNDIKNLSEP